MQNTPTIYEYLFLRNQSGLFNRSMRRDWESRNYVMSHAKGLTFINMDPLKAVSVDIAKSQQTML